jgi:hypothetical protein
MQLLKNIIFLVFVMSLLTVNTKLNSADKFATIHYNEKVFTVDFGQNDVLLRQQLEKDYSWLTTEHALDLILFLTVPGQPEQQRIKTETQFLCRLFNLFPEILNREELSLLLKKMLSFDHRERFKECFQHGLLDVLKAVIDPVAKQEGLMFVLLHFYFLIGEKSLNYVEIYGSKNIWAIVEIILSADICFGEGALLNHLCEDGCGVLLVGKVLQGPESEYILTKLIEFFEVNNLWQTYDKFDFFNVYPPTLLTSRHVQPNPLHTAGQKGLVGVVELLLAHNASPDSVDFLGCKSVDMIPVEHPQKKELIQAFAGQQNRFAWLKLACSRIIQFLSFRRTIQMQ